MKVIKASKTCHGTTADRFIYTEAATCKQRGRISIANTGKVNVTLAMFVKV